MTDNEMDRELGIAPGQFTALVAAGVFRPGITRNEAKAQIGSLTLADPGRLFDWCRAATASTKTPAQSERESVAKINLGHRLKAEEQARLADTLKKLAQQTNEV